MGPLGLLLVLAVLQGLTEFLPVSSSGHLVLARTWFPGGDSLPQDASVEIVLHLGTLLAVFLYYFQDLKSLLFGFLGCGPDVVEQRRLLLLLSLASVPIVVVGLGFQDRIEATFAGPSIAPWGLLFTGFLLWATRKTVAEKSLLEMGYWMALAIGLAQAAAILPGISRSGATIAMALFFGLRGESAARFSFLLSIPAILGAAFMKLPDAMAQESLDAFSLAAAAGLAFLVGFLALGILVRLSRSKRLSWFAPYCWLLGSCAIILK